MATGDSISDNIDPKGFCCYYLFFENVVNLVMQYNVGILSAKMDLIHASRTEWSIQKTPHFSALSGMQSNLIRHFDRRTLLTCYFPSASLPSSPVLFTEYTNTLEYVMWVTCYTTWMTTSSHAWLAALNV